jgi:hypothetical protein
MKEVDVSCQSCVVKITKQQRTQSLLFVTYLNPPPEHLPVETGLSDHARDSWEKETRDPQTIMIIHCSSIPPQREGGGGEQKRTREDRLISSLVFL